MKITQSKSVRFTPNFGGNDELAENLKFSVTLRPLSRGKFIGIVNELMQLKGSPSDVADVETLTIELRQQLAQQALKVADKVVNLFTEYNIADNIERIDNLYFNEVPVTPAILQEETVFLSLIVEIVMHIVEISNLSDIDAKN